MIADKELVICE